MNWEKLFRIWAKILCVIFIIIWIDELNVFWKGAGYDFASMFQSGWYWVYVLTISITDIGVALPLGYFGFRKKS